MKILTHLLKDCLRHNLYVLLFLALIQPFGIDRIQEGRIGFILAETVLCFMTCVVAGAICYTIYRRHEFPTQRLSTFLVRLLIFNLVNVPLLSAVLLAYNGWFFEGELLKYFYYDGHLSVMPVLINGVQVLFISVFIMLVWFYEFRTNTLNNELEEMRAINALLEQRQEQLAEEAEPNDVEVEEQPQNEVTITGQGQGAELTLDPTTIIYVESMANYADIWYIADSETRHKTLRITLRQVREVLQETECIVQCHRAFLVNMNFVVSLSHPGNGYELQLFGMEKSIPVSRANTDAMRQLLEKK